MCKTKFWCSEICLCFTVLFYKFRTKHNVIRFDCLYSYINDCVFDIRNGVLRRSVRYKKRRKPTKAGSKDRSYRQGHNYEDFQDYMKEHPDTNVVEMDCVVSFLRKLMRKLHKVLLEGTIERMKGGRTEWKML